MYMYIHTELIYSNQQHPTNTVPMDRGGCGFARRHMYSCSLLSMYMYMLNWSISIYNTAADAVLQEDTCIHILYWVCICTNWTKLLQSTTPSCWNLGSRRTDVYMNVCTYTHFELVYVYVHIYWTNLLKSTALSCWTRGSRRMGSRMRNLQYKSGLIERALALPQRYWGFVVSIRICAGCILCDLLRTLQNQSGSIEKALVFQVKYVEYVVLRCMCAGCVVCVLCRILPNVFSLEYHSDGLALQLRYVEHVFYVHVRQLRSMCSLQNSTR